MSLSTCIRFVLYVILFSSIVKGLVEGRSLKRRHGHHLHTDHYDAEKSVAHESSFRHLERLNTDLRIHDSSGRDNELWKNNDGNLKGSLRLGLRRKRHGTVTYKKMTEDDRRDLLRFKGLNADWIDLLNNQHNKKFDDYYELEVKEAQNSSICNYTVVPIPDVTGSRVPSDLEHVICNHVGSSCQDTGSYCCIQTYRKVKVTYGDDMSETMKVYAGCVCALQVYNELSNTEKALPIND